MRKICSKEVPKVLPPDLKQMRVELCEELSADTENRILNRVMTGDKVVFANMILAAIISQWNGKHERNHAQRRHVCPNRR